MKQEQRDYIVDLSSRMFIRDGVKAVTMDDIAKAAVVSKRTLYEVFGDKEELLFEAITHYFDERVVEVCRISIEAPNPLIASIKIVESTVRNSEVDWKIHRAIRASYGGVYARLKRQQQPNLDSFTKMLQGGVEQGLVSPTVDLCLSTTMLHYMASNLIHEAEDLVLPAGVTSQDAFLVMAINFVRGIATPRGVEIVDEYIRNQNK